jgi:hypothetical protein
VQERLGQSMVAVTPDTCSHLLPTLQNMAATELERLLHGRTGEIGYRLATEKTSMSS